jgi:RimJ/RimL family protein N-acetyltransferase
MDFSKFRVYLRAFEIEDFKTTHLWRGDEEIIKSVAGRKYFVSKEYEKKWINDAIFSNGNSIKLAVCMKEKDKHVGNVYLNSIDHFNKSAKSGLIIGDKSAWGQGLGTEGYIILLHHAFHDLGLIRVSATQLLDNTASIRVHEKSGFKQEGIMRKAVFKNGEFHDLNLMSILREDFDLKMSKLQLTSNKEAKPLMSSHLKI